MPVVSYAASLVLAPLLSRTPLIGLGRRKKTQAHKNHHRQLTSTGDRFTVLATASRHSPQSAAIAV